MNWKDILQKLEHQKSGMMLSCMLMIITVTKGIAMQNHTVIDLTHTINATIPTWDMSCGCTTTIVWDYENSDGPFKVRAQTFDIKASAGTHMDAPAHFCKGSTTIDQISVDRLVAPCVVIDTAANVSENYVVSMDDIAQFEAEYGTIAAGTFVLFYTGWSRYWNTPQQYHNAYKFPAIDSAVAKYLVERNILGIGIDTLSPDAGGTEFFVHVALLSAGKIIVENVASAEKLPPVGATIVIMPLKIEGATESPIRLIGFIPD